MLLETGIERSIVTAIGKRRHQQARVRIHVCRAAIPSQTGGRCIGALFPITTDSGISAENQTDRTFVCSHDLDNIIIDGTRFVGFIDHAVRITATTDFTKRFTTTGMGLVVGCRQQERLIVSEGSIAPSFDIIIGVGGISVMNLYVSHGKRNREAPAAISKNFVCDGCYHII